MRDFTIIQLFYMKIINMILQYAVIYFNIRVLNFKMRNKLLPLIFFKQKKLKSFSVYLINFHTCFLYTL